VLGGALAFGGASPLIREFVRAYGTFDVLLGVSFTPYDSAIYQAPNLIGDNLTFVLSGHFGLEFYTAPSLSVYVEAGGGFKSLFGDRDNLHAIASAWLGSGVSLKMGVRF
jgi:hypothetical protein